MSGASSTLLAAPAGAAPHLVSLVPGEWALWRWFVLRGAGFPAELANQICHSDCGQMADAVIAAEWNVQAALEEALAEINGALDQAAAFRTTQSGRASFNALLDLMRSLRSGKVAKAPYPSLEPIFDRLRQSREAAAASLRAFEAVFPIARRSQTRALTRIAADPRFREAVLWQNRAAFETAVDALAADDKDTGKKRRQYEQLLASYIQRYAVKNDTIGFFGPIAWGTVEPAGPALAALPHDALISERRVSFEVWAMDEIAATLSEMEGMRAHIAPLLAPYARVHASNLYLHGKRHSSLDTLAAATLLQCDGTVAAGEIPERVRRYPTLAGTTDAGVNRTLIDFESRGLLTWRFAVPMQANPDRALRESVSSVRNPQLRSNAFDTLDRLESARKRVSASAANPEALRGALDDLDTVFERITGKSARRNAGSMYTGRTLVYEDCRRGMDVRVSPALFEPAVPALSLLLTGGRWFMMSMADAFDRSLQSAYDELVKAQNTPEIPADAFWLKVQRLLLQGIPAAAERVEREFEKKWINILALAGESRERRFTSRALARPVASAFPAVAAPAFCPRYFCPDLMIAASDQRAIESGDVLYILGEMHLANNTLLSSLFVEMHPAPGDVADAVRWDFPRDRLCILNSRQWPRVTTRTNRGVTLESDILLAATSDATAPSGTRAHPISSFIVGRSSAGLVLRTRDGLLSFPILEAFAEPLYGVVMNRARILPNAAHAPRIVIDKLVISRESWTACVSELSFAWEKDESRRYLGMRRWAASQRMPPAMFAKTPLEVKPVYLHLDGPIYVETVCKMIRSLETAKGPDAEIAFSEMLPSHEHLWLRDAAGNRYTSELRFTIVDLRLRAAERDALAPKAV